MARHSPITGDDNYFIGEQKFLVFPLFDGDEEDSQLMTIPGDWTVEWVLRDGRDGDILFTIDDTSITRVDLEDIPNASFRVAVPAANTKDLDAKTYFHTLRRTDVGHETVLSFGDCVLKWAATR